MQIFAGLTLIATADRFPKIPQWATEGHLLTEPTVSKPAEIRLKLTRSCSAAAVFTQTETVRFLYTSGFSCCPEMIYHLSYTPLKKGVKTSLSI